MITYLSREPQEDRPSCRERHQDRGVHVESTERQNRASKERDSTKGEHDSLSEEFRRWADVEQDHPSDGQAQPQRLVLEMGDPVHEAEDGCQSCEHRVEPTRMGVFFR